MSASTPLAPSAEKSGWRGDELVDDRDDVVVGDPGALVVADLDLHVAGGVEHEPPADAVAARVVVVVDVVLGEHERLAPGRHPDRCRHRPVDVDERPAVGVRAGRGSCGTRRRSRSSRGSPARRELVRERQLGSDHERVEEQVLDRAGPRDQRRRGGGGGRRRGRRGRRGVGGRTRPRPPTRRSSCRRPTSTASQDEHGDEEQRGGPGGASCPPGPSSHGARLATTSPSARSGEGRRRPPRSRPSVTSGRWPTYCWRGTSCGPRTWPTPATSRRSTVADLASAAGLSPAYFSREFRRSFGEPPHQYLLTRRLERAAALLRTTDRTRHRDLLRGRAPSLGSFTTSFRRVYGSTPTRLPRLVPATRVDDPHPGLRGQGLRPSGKPHVSRSQRRACPVPSRSSTPDPSQEVMP